MDIHTLLRRLQIGQKDRAIACALNVNRMTVAKYRTWAQNHNLLKGPLRDL